MVIYTNRSCSWPVTSITSLIGKLTDKFSGVIKYIKEHLTNIVVILKA